MNSEPNANDRLIDAIAAAATRGWTADALVSDEEIQELLNSADDLSAEDQAAIDSLGPEFVRKLVQSASAQPLRQHTAKIDPAIDRAFVAMNRRNEADDLSDKARSALDRKRRELRGGS